MSVRIKEFINTDEAVVQGIDLFGLEVGNILYTREEAQVDLRKLHDALLTACMQYQWRLDYPFPIPEQTAESINVKYRTNPVFHSKVQNLVNGIMHVITNNL